MMGRHNSAAWVACAVTFFIGTAHGQVTRDQAARLAVDVVLVRGGDELRGSIVSREDDGALTIAVRRDWLRNHQPQRLAAGEQLETARRLEAYQQLVDRIQDWLRGCEEESEIAAILRSELDRYAEYVENPDLIPQAEPSEFLLVELVSGEVRRVYAQQPQQRQAALVAWQEQLPHVENSRFRELGDALAARDIDWRNAHVDLSDRLPTGMPQSEQEWAARRAIYEFAFLNRIEFQGTGDMVFRTDAKGEQPGLEQLLGGLLNGGLNVDLEQLLGGTGPGEAARRPDWRETAIQSVADDGTTGFRVTRVDTDLQNSRVTVQAVFLARIDENSWETIWKHHEMLDATEQRDALADRIRQDPQVAESLKLLESLGLQQGVQQAIQFGAATMEAQQTADDRFFEFFNRYTQRLDGPPLRWEQVESP